MIKGMWRIDVVFRNGSVTNVKKEQRYKDRTL